MYANDPYWIDQIARRAAQKKRAGEQPLETRQKMVRRLARGAPQPWGFMDDEGEFIPNKFAKWVMSDSEQRYVCDMNSDELFYYDRGTYHPRADVLIEQLLVAIMDGDGLTIDNIKTAVYLIKRRAVCEIVQ